MIIGEKIDALMAERPTVRSIFVLWPRLLEDGRWAWLERVYAIRFVWGPGDIAMEYHATREEAEASADVSYRTSAPA